MLRVCLEVQPNPQMSHKKVLRDPGVFFPFLTPSVGWGLWLTSMVLIAMSSSGGTSDTEALRSTDMMASMKDPSARQLTIVCRNVSRFGHFRFQLVYKRSVKYLCVPLKLFINCFFGSLPLLKQSMKYLQ